MSGKGFARRVTLENLQLFSPLLGKGKSRAARDESTSPRSGGAGSPKDPELAVTEKLFAGIPFKTGVGFDYGHRVREQPSPRGIGNVAGLASNYRGRTEELLMRVKPRRTGTQLQISLVVHRSNFMRNASQVVAASDGTIRPIGFDYARKSKKPNLARFEASEMGGMKEPVVRFRWIDSEGANSHEMLQYEVFDAAKSPEGKRIRALLMAGIGRTPNTKLAALGQTETVLSKGNPESAQWYRLNSQE